VEQGPVLERQGRPAAVVSTIAGIERVLIQVEGRPDHAGTTPMEQRHDALTAAAELVLAVERSAKTGGVATTGRLELEPGAANIVPGRARLWCEFRSAEAGWLAERRLFLEESARELAARRGVQIELRWLSAAPPVPASPEVKRVIASAMEALGLPSCALISGAGHDAAHMAAVALMGMVFIPSQGGRSHVPEEFTDLAQVGMGVRILAQSLVQLDRSLEPVQHGRASPAAANRQREK
jgi:N-carbamoyl-L-amino-acid hydrolase